MKVGDKILCKKTIIIRWNSKISYKKGKHYTLGKGRDEYEFLVYPSEWEVGNTYFDVRKDKVNSLYKYFYTKQQELHLLRKKKLDKIYDNTN